MPRAFFTAVEEAAHRALRQGLHGWQVTGRLVTAALARAGTAVFEPLRGFLSPPSPASRPRRW
ncbi:MAG TPA: hypothetical protein VG164_13115 [Trebonia sp.]|jgi:hypothetical protein|nr:hypothetical protein [Trebonia sp.]